MSFEAIATNIIQESIRSAVCIDDEFVEPYMSVNTEDYNYLLSKKLFDSFRKNGCSLDIYKYEATKWSEDRTHILKYRDLLILDWQLPSHEPSLEILKEAIELPSLPFVIIYTNLVDMTEIMLNIFSFFGTPYLTKGELEDLYTKICDKLEDEFEFIENPDNVFRDFIGPCKDFVIAKDDTKKKITEEIDSSLKKRFGTDYSIFKMVISKNFGFKKIEDFITFLGVHLNNALVSASSSTYDISLIDGATNSFLVNDTIIVVFNKQKPTNSSHEDFISPENIYVEFANKVNRRPRNFLALLSLEMKNLYRDNAGTMGNGLYKIDETAFFHHQSNLSSNDEFHDFLKHCWQDELVLFNYGQTPTLFSVLNDYKKASNILNQVRDSKSSGKLPTFQEELAKLNNFYSFSKVKRKPNDRVRFGDLFVLSKCPDESQMKNFILCITAHCDCCHPENVHNTFYFVSGSSVPLDKGLKFAEKEYYSFVIYNGKPICVEWTGKPFTLYISPEKNCIKEEPIPVNYHGSDHYLIHKATLKENYAQRVANYSFSHASRVGINLVVLDLDKEKETS